LHTDSEYENILPWSTRYDNTNGISILAVFAGVSTTTVIDRPRDRQTVIDGQTTLLGL